MRESTRINALESRVQQIAIDLSSSKDQLREVKELLFQLINPLQPHRPSTLAPALTSNAVWSRENTIAELLRHRSPARLSNPPAPMQSPAIAPIRPTQIPAATPKESRPLSASQTPAVCRNTVAASSPSWAFNNTVPMTPNTLARIYVRC